MIGLIGKTFLLMFLGVSAWIDHKDKCIPWIIPAAGSISGTVIGSLAERNSPLQMILGTVIGLAVLILGFASGEKIGYGDGFIICVTGIILGWMNNLILFMIALFLCAAFSIILMILKLKNRKDTVPFIPFMLGGYVLMLGVYM